MFWKYETDGTYYNVDQIVSVVRSNTNGTLTLNFSSGGSAVTIVQPYADDLLKIIQMYGSGVRR